MGASRSNPRSPAFRRERTIPTDGPRIRNTTTNVHHVRFIPIDRKTGPIIKSTRAGDQFQFSDRAYQIGPDGSLRRIHRAKP